MAKRHHLDKRAALLEKLQTLDDEQRLTTPEVAEWLGVSEIWLEIGRSKCGGYGPPYEKNGRMVRYRVGSVKEYLRKRVQTIDPEQRG